MNNLMDMALLCITTLILLLASYMDYTERVVPNQLTFPAIAAGIICSAFISPTVFISRLAWLVGFFFFGMLGLMGMGDLKLLMAIIALRGVTEGIYTLLFGSLSLLLFCAVTKPGTTFYVLADTAKMICLRIPIQKRSNETYPFAVFMAFGYPIAYMIANYGLSWRFTNAVYF